MAVLDAKLLEVALKDPRYAYEAYDFIFKALDHAQALVGKKTKPKCAESSELAPRDIRSQELLEGIRSLALQEFGLMAQTVFRMWGIASTEDFGRVVFNLVEAGLITKTEDETIDDFRNAFDFDEALVQAYTIELDGI